MDYCNDSWMKNRLNRSIQFMSLKCVAMAQNDKKHGEDNKDCPKQFSEKKSSFARLNLLTPLACPQSEFFFCIALTIYAGNVIYLLDIGLAWWRSFWTFLISWYECQRHYLRLNSFQQKQITRFFLPEVVFSTGAWNIHVRKLAIVSGHHPTLT